MHFEIAIIGGGVVGSACFNKLVRLGKKCVLIEKQNDVGFGPSKANSGIIHAGFDCLPNTKKAKFNVLGNKMFPQIAKRLGVPFKQNGNLVVGNDLTKLKDLIERGKQNGVPNLRLLNTTELHQMEPNLRADILYGLFAPTGGEISSYELAIAFCEEAIINGGKVFLNFNTININKSKSGFEIISQDGKVVTCNKIVNCAGGGYNDIAKILGTETYPFEFRRGEYYLLDKTCSGFVNHTIFPLPTEKSKGVLLSETPHGNIIVGPTSYISDENTKTTVLGLSSIKEQANCIFEKIPFNKNIRNFSGVRTICGKDFIVENSQKVDSVINVAGICSPGLTSSPAIAEYIASLLKLDPNKEIAKLKQRKSYSWFKSLSIKEKNEIIAKDSDYGKVVCRCENVTLGEIKDALRSPLPAQSIDGIKRRTRAGMGRCQGGFCLFQVMEEIAKEEKIELLKVLKDEQNSFVYKSEIKVFKGSDL